ncbi:HAMP domain-containing protein [Frankia sp. CNm7]|nr:HAMP domain-containing protein [Frankia nepalensis]MBL7513683.1 HAMP domain-containing protein [Frankia nepalensis]MBL7517449.1 HAMP domain-containing protein [Frankia nepalensis]
MGGTDQRPDPEPGSGTGLPRYGPPALPAGPGATGTPSWQGTPEEFLLWQPNQSFGTVAARVVDGRVQDAMVLEATSVTTGLAADLADRLAALPADGVPRTIALGGLGDYRVTATRIDGRDIGGGDTGGEDVVVVSGLSLAEVDATVNRLLLIAGCVAGGGVLLLGVVGAVTVRRTLRPLRRVAATAATVAELPLDRGEVTLRVRVPRVDTDPRTEVGQVGAALNHMLGHVAAALAARHASETRVRQFVADASHELRTPLAAISGYAQLTRRIGDQVPPDVAYALRRVESETRRMTTLVEDLLLLARLDSGRPLEHGCVDLSRLVVDVVSDAHIAAPGHRFSLNLPAEPVTVRGDAARLHQVLANLLANARAHTPPGTSVTVALEVCPTPGGVTGRSASAGELHLSVIDNGPGISPELLPNIFERFARGDSSRSRAAGSTGLGLAIVAAVVEAHAGRIAVTSVPGRTAFTVTLPLIPADSPGTPDEVNPDGLDRADHSDEMDTVDPVTAASPAAVDRPATRSARSPRPAPGVFTAGSQ